MIVTTDAIVLHSRRFGDTSRIVVLYTYQLGKISVMARGSRTPKSAFGSALEPLTHCRATIYHKKQRDLHTISAAECLAPGAWALASYNRLKSALVLCEWVIRTQADEAPAEDVFHLLADTLADIERGSEEHAYGASIRFRLKLAELMGFGLAVTSPTDSIAVKISLEDGIARSESSHGVRLSGSAFNHLSFVLDQKQHNISESDQLELDAFLALYFSHHLDRRVTSRVSDTLR